MHWSIFHPYPIIHMSEKLKSTIDSPRRQPSAWSLETCMTAECLATAGTFSKFHQNPFIVLQDNRDPDLSHRAAPRSFPRSPFCPSNPPRSNPPRFNQAQRSRIPRNETNPQRSPTTPCPKATNATQGTSCRCQGVSLSLATSSFIKYQFDATNKWDSDSCEKLRLNSELKNIHERLHGKNTPENLLQASYGTNWFQFTSTHVVSTSFPL